MSNKSNFFTFSMTITPLSLRCVHTLWMPLTSCFDLTCTRVQFGFCVLLPGFDGGLADTKRMSERLGASVGGERGRYHGLKCPRLHTPSGCLAFFGCPSSAALLNNDRYESKLFASGSPPLLFPSSPSIIWPLMRDNFRTRTPEICLTWQLEAANSL